jgi:DNA primase
MNSEIVLEYLEKILGKSHKRSKGNYAFHCPFCHHRKPKLEVQLYTDKEGKNPWACWVCRKTGKRIYSLLHELNIDKATTLKILKYVTKGNYTYHENQYSSIELPKEFRPLHKEKSNSIVVKSVKNYLYNRGLSDIDFLRYNIGFCTEGDYRDRIIIPSYDSSNILNFFVSRSYIPNRMSYKLPNYDKDIIFFENLINWELPIVLCEGVFDAMSIRRNAIPVLGKFIQNNLLIKLISSDVEQIYVALDQDAKEDAIEMADILYHYGKEVYFVDLCAKDPSELGFDEFSKLLDIANVYDDYFLLNHKLSSL